MNQNYDTEVGFVTQIVTMCATNTRKGRLDLNTTLQADPVQLNCLLTKLKKKKTLTEGQGRRASVLIQANTSSTVRLNHSQRNNLTDIIQTGRTEAYEKCCRMKVNVQTRSEEESTETSALTGETDQGGANNHSEGQEV